MTLSTEKYIWEITDKYGWELDDAHKREFEINSILYKDDINKLIGSIETFCDLRLTYYTKSDIYDMRYTNHHLEARNIKFSMDFSDTDDFIEKLLIDNGWEISKRSKFVRNKIF